MSLVLPDGEGVALAARFLARENVKRISFDMTSLADPFFKEILALGASVALIGGKPGVTEDVRDKLKTHYAGLTIVEAFHGYGEIDSKIAEIIKIGAEVVIVGMGAPQQEIFLLELKKAGYAGMSITCGGFFDQYLTAEDKN
jgi:N-acetylglucosaminyldiphosphoundecaprenol N-acetyl-beta-D-mannosaminyltransferase